MRLADVPVFQFVALCALPVAAIVYAVRTRGTQTWKSRLGTVLVAMVIFALSVPMFMGMCGNRSNPSYQTLIPLVSALLIALVTGAPRLRWRGIAGCYAAYLALMFHYESVVHGPHYVGTRRARGIEPERIVAEWHTPLTHIYRVQGVVVRAGCTERAPRGHAPS